jgi:peroxiredoxin Q/BCP
MSLKPGSPAPDFTVKDQNGKEVSLSQFKGKKVVIYFYPKDDTPTCTTQACNLRDNIAGLKRKGIVVLGVSMDTEKKHKKFEQKYNLPFPLLADTDRKIIDAYEIWGEKMLFGRKYMGIRRYTFLINENGIIDHIIDKVEAKNHTAQILELWGL